MMKINDIVVFDNPEYPEIYGRTGRIKRAYGKNGIHVQMEDDGCYYIFCSKNLKVVHPENLPELPVPTLKEIIDATESI